MYARPPAAMITTTTAIAAMVRSVNPELPEELALVVALVETTEDEPAEEVDVEET